MNNVYLLISLTGIINNRLGWVNLCSIFRFYSQQWRTWAACYIQTAWRRHRKKKQEQNRRTEDALTASRVTSSLSFGAAIYVAIFSSNVLRILRKNQTYNAQLSTPNMQLMLPLKPPQPHVSQVLVLLFFMISLNVRVQIE